MPEAFKALTATWKHDDGLPMVDYSRQSLSGQRGKHAESLVPKHFLLFLAESKPYDFDVMLEIKDKESSALKAVKLAMGDSRFVRSLYNFGS